MRCSPAAIFCCLLFLCAALSQADAPASGILPVTVRDSRGPLVGVWLTLHPLGHSVMTDGKGAATFTGLPPGSYTVSLAPASYFPLNLPITLSANAPSRLVCVLDKNGASNITTQDAAGTHYQITVPPVPRPVNPPPEYLPTPPVPPGSGPAWRTAQETTLREAMFRYLFTSFPPDADWQPKVYYLSVQALPWEHGAEESKDPDAALLERFRSSKQPVEGVSALLRNKNWNKQARHHWIIYCVSSFRWAGDTSVVIYSEKSFSHSFQGNSIYLTCTLRNGWWEITQAAEAAA